MLEDLRPDPLGTCLVITLNPKWCQALSVQGLKPKSLHAQNSSGVQGLPYLDPKEPTFLGFPILISLYKSLKR